MFEMKNESDATATKKRNEDFLKELDKDRTDKKCEYAILVSALESESELYNAGIVDVSYRFPKMFVVRPQNFISNMTLLRNAAMNSLQYKSELALVRSQNIDYQLRRKNLHLEAKSAEYIIYNNITQKTYIFYKFVSISYKN